MGRHCRKKICRSGIRKVNFRRETKSPRWKSTKTSVPMRRNKREADLWLNSEKVRLRKSGCIRSLLVLIIILMTRPVDAKQCELNGKTILFEVEECIEPTGQCLRGPLRIEIVQDNLLYFMSMKRNIGLIFKIGKSIDMLADANQKQNWYDDLRMTGTYMQANGSVYYVGEELRIMEGYTHHASAAGILYNRFFQKDVQIQETVRNLAFRIQADCRRCELVSHAHNSRLYDGRVSFRTSLRSHSCSIGLARNN